MDIFKVYLVGNSHCTICLKTRNEAKLLSKHNAADFFNAVQMLQSTPWICVWCSSKLRHFQDLRRRARRSEDLLNALRYNMEQVKGNISHYAGVLQQIKTEKFMPVMRKAATLCFTNDFQSTTKTSIGNIPTERNTAPTRISKNLNTEAILQECVVKVEPSTKMEPLEEIETKDDSASTKTPDEPNVYLDIGNGDSIKMEDPLNATQAELVVPTFSNVARSTARKFDAVSQLKLSAVRVYSHVSKTNKPTPVAVSKEANTTFTNSYRPTVPLGSNHIDVSRLRAAEVGPMSKKAVVISCNGTRNVSSGNVRNISYPGSTPVPVSLDKHTLLLKQLIKEGKEVTLAEQDSIMDIFEDVIKSNVLSVRMTEAQEKNYSEKITNSSAYKRRPFKCRLCLAAFDHEDNYKEHFKKHTGMFQSIPKLQHHKDAVHENTLAKNNLCDVCGKAFSAHRLLETHRLIHTGARPHACEQCGKTFRQRAAMRTHVKLVHEGIRYSDLIAARKARRAAKDVS